VIYSNVLITINYESSVVTVAYNQKDINETTEINNNNFMLGIRFENPQLQNDFQKYFQVSIQSWNYDYQNSVEIDQNIKNFE
jgi:hypothetical protein